MQRKMRDAHTETEVHRDRKHGETRRDRSRRAGSRLYRMREKEEQRGTEAFVTGVRAEGSSQTCLKPVRPPNCHWVARDTAHPQQLLPLVHGTPSAQILLPCNVQTCYKGFFFTTLSRKLSLIASQGKSQASPFLVGRGVPRTYP